MFLIYNFSISGNYYDYNISKEVSRNNINFDDLIKHPKILKNNNVYEKYKELNKYCPNINIINDDLKKEYNIKYNVFEIYYINYFEEEFEISSLFFHINNIELIDNDKIENIVEYPEYNFLRTSFDRTIKIQNNLLDEYDKNFNIEFIKFKQLIEQKPKYKLKTIKLDLLNTKLYNYQINNLNWMIDMEKNPLKHHITNDKLLFLSDNRIYNLNNNKIIYKNQIQKTIIKGGIISDEPGLGKTLQLLTLCAHNLNIKTLILAPEHLIDYWKEQIKLHFNNKLENIKIIDFNTFKYSIDEFKNYKVDRLIIDEIHELLPYIVNEADEVYENEKIFEVLIKMNCKYKWGITATPFINNKSLFYFMQYLTNYELSYENIYRCSYIWDLFPKIFKKNMYNNVSDEIILPKINIHNIFSQLNINEKLIYDSELSLKKYVNEDILRQICCDLTMDYTDEKYMNINDFKRIIVNKFEENYEYEKNKLKYYNLINSNLLKSNSYERFLKKFVCNNKKIIKLNSFNNKKEALQYLTELMEEQKNITNNQNRRLNFIKNQINDEKICPTCLDIINEDEENYCILPCGHIFCKICNEILITQKKSNFNCSICRKNTNINNIYTITKNNELKHNYSSKINKLIEIINQLDDKVIIYSQYDKILLKLNNILQIENIDNILFKDSYDIERFKINSKVLLLSSNKNSSGIDLSFVKNLIIFEPIKGSSNFMKDIKKQIIGRIYRIGQLNEINIYFLITQNTIEETDYK